MPKTPRKEGEGGSGNGCGHLPCAPLAFAFHRGEIGPRKQQPKVRGVDGRCLHRDPNLIVLEGARGLALQGEGERAVVGKGAAQLKLRFAEGHGMLLNQPRRRVWGNLFS